MIGEEFGTDPDTTEFVRKYKWMVRPCEDYSKEASVCKSFHKRFHQYFVHGSFTDCSAWLQDKANCSKCIDGKDDKACREIIKNEGLRRLKRYQSFMNNDVWEKRSKPPENWNSKLPEEFTKNKENSLFLMAKDELDEEMRGDPPKRSCTIS